MMAVKVVKAFVLYMFNTEYFMDLQNITNTVLDHISSDEAQCIQEDIY